MILNEWKETSLGLSDKIIKYGSQKNEPWLKDGIKNNGRLFVNACRASDLLVKWHYKCRTNIAVDVFEFWMLRLSRDLRR